NEPGCNKRVKSGKCDEHKRDARRQSDSRRGTRTERGYSNRWGEYRRHFLKANPLCVHCLKAGVYASATIVDHIIPIEGEADVLFWPASNHQSLCAACHGRKTTTTDPVTKQQRKAGKFREQEEAARHRTDWIYEANND
ncbi:HNH endonuclease, partial [Enterobacter hormaechei]|nr:HNH endonuclease [Enterobacter hormaechei]